MTQKLRFQFTRPHGARPDVSSIHPRSSSVSIHAPTRGATSARHPAPQMRRFNSRAHTGRDQRPASAIRDLIGFNSRAHTGRDGRHRRRRQGHRAVSIHAPTRGATIGNGGNYLASEFQFTRPHGARPYWSNHSATSSSFNSRAHTGRDGSSGQARACAGVSIHAPTRGATLARGHIQMPPRSFNSRAHTGRDPPASEVKANEGAFQFTRPHGARPETL